MKTKIVKTAFATACVVAAGMGCFKAYTAPSQSESSMLLAENVEALSDNDGDKGKTPEKTHWVETDEVKERPYNTDEWIPINRCKESTDKNDHCTLGSWQFDFSRYKG